MGLAFGCAYPAAIAQKCASTEFPVTPDWIRGMGMNIPQGKMFSNPDALMYSLGTWLLRAVGTGFKGTKTFPHPLITADTHTHMPTLTHPSQFFENSDVNVQVSKVAGLLCEVGKPRKCHQVSCS